MANKIFRIVIIIFFLSGGLYAQQLQPSGQFIKDSIKIGKETIYSLSVSYPKEMSVVFPDSTYNFSPFEYSRKIYFETRTEGKISVDSVVYYLMSFDMDSIQGLALPVFVVSGNDSTAVYAEPDSVFMKTPAPEGEGELKETIAYQDVRLQFNYPYLIVALVILAIIALAVLLIFGKQIRKKIKLYRLQRSHQRFLEKFMLLINDLKNKPSSTQTEKTLSFWKKYMEKLENQPYTKFTTKEIALYSQDQQLKDTLRSIDRSIYGGYQAGAEDNFNELKTITDGRYKIKIEEVQHA